MSIINDALKKLQIDLANNSAGSAPGGSNKIPLPKKNLPTTQIQTSTGGSSPAPKPPIYPPRTVPTGNEGLVAPAIPSAQKPVPLTPPPKKTGRFLPFLALTILLLFSLALRHDIRENGRSLLPTRPQPGAVPADALAPETGLPAGLQPQSADLPANPAPAPMKDPVVSGIVTMNNSRVALIDNAIYEVGNTIGDMRIVAITLDQVEVEENGQKRSLTVRHKP